MRKYLCLVCVILMSCNPVRQITTEISLPIEDIYFSFIQKNPNWQQNDIIYQEKMQELKKIIDDTLQKDNILCGIPMEVEGMNRNDKLKLTIVHLGSWLANKYILDYVGGLSEVNVDVFAEINDDIVAKLNDSQKYRLYGQFISRLETMGQIKFIYGEKPHSVYSPSVRISRDIPYVSSAREFNLGILYFKADSLVPVSSANARSKIITTMKGGEVINKDTIDVLNRF